MARENIMLCYPWSVERLEKYPKPYIVQPKLNGDRCRVIFGPDQRYLLSSEGNEIPMLPHIQEEIEKLYIGIRATQGLAYCELDGELYSHGMSHQDIHGIVSRTVNLHPDYEKIELHLFDIPSIAGIMQVKRTTYLADLITGATEAGFVKGHIKLVPSAFLNSVEEVKKAVYNLKNIQGYEGAVIKSPNVYYTRSRSTEWMKVKPRRFDTYTIVGYAEEIDIHGTPKGSLGKFIVKDSDNKEFRVGSGFTQAEREAWWDIREGFIGRDILVLYPELTKRGIPNNPIFKCLHKEGMIMSGIEEIRI